MLITSELLWSVYRSFGKRVVYIYAVIVEMAARHSLNVLANSFPMFSITVIAFINPNAPDLTRELKLLRMHND